MLRPATAADLAAFHAILSDPRAMRYWSTPPHPDLETTERWLASMLQIAAGEGEDFAIELDGQLIGKAGLFRFPEIGYILHPRAWGRGLAQEALAPVLHRAFSVHGLDAVEADVDPRNTASVHTLGRMGFEEAGRAARTMQVGGQWCDSVYMKLERARWASRPVPAPVGHV